MPDKLPDLLRQTQTQPVRIGEITAHTVNLGDFSVEFGASPALLANFIFVEEKPGSILTIGKPKYSTFNALDIAIQQCLSTMNENVYRSFPYGSFGNISPAVIILSHESYQKCFSAGTAPSEWAGVCMRDGRVIYDENYLNTVLAGDSNFGGHNFIPQYFFRELKHELHHLDVLTSIFLDDLIQAEHFNANSLFVIEGMAELIPGIVESSDTFRENLKHYLDRNRDFSTKDLETDLFHVDGGPVGRNLAYQYSARWMRQLAKAINEFYTKKYPDDPATKPYERAYAIWAIARNRYNSGSRESYYDVLEAEFSEYGVTKKWLLEEELKWQKAVLSGEAE